MTYFNQVEGQNLTGAGAVSGDDVNRHLRESRLGFCEPSPDWADSHRVIRCIWPNQTVYVRPINTDGESYYHAPGLISAALLLE